MKRSVINLIGACIILVTAGCNSNKDKFPAHVVGYKPVYVKPDKLTEMIYTTGPIDLKQPGQLYIKDNYIYLNEVDQGVHVINNSNPEAPAREAFIKIPGNQHIAIKGHTLYANLPTGIVIIDITDPKQATAKNYIKDNNANSATPASVPDRYVDPKSNRTYFECVDETKGIVIGWEKTDLDHPNCFIK